MNQSKEYEEFVKVLRAELYIDHNSEIIYKGAENVPDEFWTHKDHTICLINPGDEELIQTAKDQGFLQ